ncbi:ankyrin repeat domain-containing protein [Hymenobacter tibetensis]|uniref:Ankyrin repeat domain-containing protein n=1 Tax=Hymenobacter tibetensis TaxID=497967 RepID=A0ABY4CSV6_9BACT|nr:ankyrin repeat domain-containing protein [Hymenobacter tibetensis]UOG73127.1 ankyrin repeat domain-containing protein [Hymenobacter tibetensis]
MARAGRPHKSDPRVDDVLYSIKKDDASGVKQLLSEIGIDACDGYLRTALLWATFYGNTPILEWLIDNGANSNHQDRNGYCALHFAGQEKQFECAELLLTKGANLELPDIHGNTPIWTALFNAKDDHRLVNLYLQKGANLDHLNKYGKTPRQVFERVSSHTQN